MIARPGGDVERYICGLLRLPVPETDAEFQWIVWLIGIAIELGSLSRRLCIGTYPEPGCFAYLMHEIPGYEGPLGLLPADVWFQPDGLRPVVVLHDGDHPLWMPRGGE